MIVYKTSIQKRKRNNMKEKTWDVHTLNNRLNYYQKLLTKAKTQEEKMALYKTIKSYQEFISTFHNRYKKPSFSYIAQADRNFFEKSIQTISILLDANNYIVSNGINLTAEASNIIVPKEKIITATNDFYNYIGGIYLERYNEYYQTGAIYIKFSKAANNKLGGDILIPEGVNEAFINVNSFNGLFDIATSVHEHGHAIGTSINKNHLRNPFVNEVETIFFELLYLDTIDKNEYDFEEIKKAKAASIFIYNGYLNSIDFKYMTTLKGISDRKRAQEIIREKYELDADYIDGELLYPLDNLVNYATSYLVAIELFLLYKRNSYAALNILEQIIRIESYNEEDILNTLHNYGIIPGKNLKAFYKQYLNIKGTSKKLH